jgi:hypothetical protein
VDVRRCRPYHHGKVYRQTGESDHDVDLIRAFAIRRPKCDCSRSEKTYSQ